MHNLDLVVYNGQDRMQKVKQNSRYKIFCLMAMVMFAQSVIIYKIFANKIKYLKFDLKKI